MTAFATRYGAPRTPSPRVSVVTTVYDRTPDLARCLRSIECSVYQDLEHIIVSDAPGVSVEAEILRIVRGDPRRRYLALADRTDDWGRTPAAVGLEAAVGAYVCFLSDDNAYLPAHFPPLVAALDADPGLGFVYSGCQYAGRTVLNEAPPRGSRIDLGQPLFRRSVLEAHIGPVRDHAKHHAWDWSLIQRMMAAGVRWQHLKATTFIFSVEKYPAIRKSLEAAP